LFNVFAEDLMALSESFLTWSRENIISELTDKLLIIIEDEF